MKIFTLSTLSGLTLTLFLTACNKHHDVPPIVDPPQVGTISINLATNAVAAGASIEVIISESGGGKVLLDTLGPFNNSLVAALHTNQKLLDYTLITYNNPTSEYQVTTYKAVDLSSWTALSQIDYSATVPPVASRQASIFYTNPPLNRGSGVYINDYVVSSGFSGYSMIDASPLGTGFSYTQYGNNNYLYLLFPGTGLYNFHIPKGLTDTVDLSHMDTAVMYNFKMPVGYSLTLSNLVGIMDTTDPGRSLLLYNSLISPASDMEYPRKVVQKYEPHIYANNSNGYNKFEYYSYGDSIPATLPIPNASEAYTISASKNTNFSVKFGSAKPSYYCITLASFPVTLTLNCPPDSTMLNPVGMLTSLTSKLLKGRNLSNLVPGTFQYESAQGFKYQDFFSYVHNTDMIKARRVPVSIKFSEDF